MEGSTHVFFPLSPCGRGDSRSQDGMTGHLSRMETPHPASASAMPTFSHRGEGKKRCYAPTAFFRQARCTAQVQPGGCEATSLAGTISGRRSVPLAAACTCEGM